MITLTRAILRRWLAVFTFSTLSAAPANPRLVTLADIPDAGLTAGPRDVHVYLPPGYAESTERYRVIYFHDGEGVLGAFNGTRGVQADADYALDQLLDERLVHPAILVAVANAKGVTNGRGRDLVPRWTPDAPGRAEDYYTFLATRLKPMIDAHFRTLPEARHTGVAGYSLGGLASFYFGYRHPETFGMAICSSPSLWHTDSFLVREVAGDPVKRTATRFWIDGGEKDAADIETIAPVMTRLLLGKGWREGSDIAFQLGYGHTHSRKAMRERLRNALYFLLRREAPAVQSLRLRPLADPSALSLDLVTAGERALVWPEVGFEHGFYLNSVAIPVRSEDAGVAVVDDSGPGRIRAMAAGSTALHAEFQGYRARLPVKSYVPGRYARLPIARAPAPVTVDGDLGEWSDLPHRIVPDSEAGRATARFATAYDDHTVFVAVAVTDPHVVVRPGRPSKEQDGVEVWLDHRPDPARAESKAWDDGYQSTFLLIRATPATVPPPPASIRAPLPPGVQRAVRRTPAGYDVEFAIPIVDWTEFRLNVHLTDFADASTPAVELWWQPPWRSPESRAGSGTFRR